MSIRAITWVMNEAPVEDARQLLILYALADRAHDDGTCAWPSQEWIAERARCTSRTVRNHLQKLEEDGLISRGDQQHVAHIRKDRRPIVWDLNLDKVRPEIMTGRKSSVERPETCDTTAGNLASNGRKQLFPTNHPKPSMNHPEPLSSSSDEQRFFDEFWKYYPRKGAKRKAEEKWGIAIVDTDPQLIIEGAKKYRDQTNGVDRTYVKLPSTWLNQRCWEDHVELSVIDKLMERDSFDDGDF